MMSESQIPNPTLSSNRIAGPEVPNIIRTFNKSWSLIDNKIYKNNICFIFKKHSISYVCSMYIIRYLANAMTILLKTKIKKKNWVVYKEKTNKNTLRIFQSYKKKLNIWKGFLRDFNNLMSFFKTNRTFCQVSGVNYCA